MPLGVSQDGEGGVRGGVNPSQLFQGLTILFQSLGGSLETVREGQGGEGGGWGDFGLRVRVDGTQGKTMLQPVAFLFSSFLLLYLI